MPHGKDPYAKYSPHACNSGTRDPKIALAPWAAGEEANYGISCGMSNLTVLDVDKGIEDVAQFEAWKKEHGIPETFTVLSGRDGFGAHLYFSGSVPTTKFQIGTASGDFKGIGGYVVGAGSWHPSGKQYTIYKNVDIIPLPPGLVALAAEKEKPVFKTKADGGDLISLGNRRTHIMSAAGKFRNAGLDEDGIYEALKNFAANNCEDGENYPDDKLKEISSAAFNKFDAAESTPVVFFGEGKKLDTGLVETPNIAIDGDWIGDMTHLVTDGTFIPPAFARAQLKTILGASVDGMVGFPNQKDLHMKHWTMLISAHPESGKGESWKRTGESALLNYINKTSVGLPKAGLFSSGEHMVKYLSEGFDNSNVVVYFDEMKTLFEKGAAQNSTLLSKMIELYDRSEGSAGSLSNKGGEFSDISISFTGGFTRASFDRVVTGKGAAGSGFMSRCVLAYTNGVTHIGDWAEQDTAAVNALAAKMLVRWGELTTAMSQSGERWIPVETHEANAMRQEFQKALAKKKVKMDIDYVDAGMTSRLESHFKRDLLLRTIFSDDQTITEEKVSRAIAWAEHEIYLREELYPVDDGNLVERMEQSMRRSLRKHEFLTKKQLQDACNVHRAGSGGMDTFNRSWKAMLMGGVIVVVGKTHKGTEKFGLNEG
jgi:hypothetical protein